MGKRIAVFPEPGAIGPAMNLVGICQGLRELGHESIFVLEPGLSGTAARVRVRGAAHVVHGADVAGGAGALLG